MVGIFLTTFNFIDKTRACLESLIRTVGKNVRLLVMDNASNDGTKEYVHSIGLEFLANPAPVGLATALNQGMRHLLADRRITHVCWIHNDMLFFKGWLEGLIEVAAQPDIGKLAPWNVAGDPSQYSDEWAERFMEGHRNEFIPGNNCPWIMRRDVVEKVGLFDERYIKCGGHEDWDYNNRVIDTGFKVGTTGASVVWHEGMGTRRHIDNSDACIINACVYASKWGGRQWV